MAQDHPPVIVKEAEIETVRRWLNARPDLLLAIAKRHTTNPLLQPLPTSSISLPPTLTLHVPIDGLKVDKLRIKVSTKARNVELDIPLSFGSDKGLGKGGFGRRMEELGEDALRHFDIPRHPQINYFEPPTSISVLPFYPLLLLIFLVAAPANHGVANLLRGVIERYLGRWMIPGAAWFAAACHLVIEPLILVPKLIQHQVPLLQSLFYLFTVFCTGYGGIDALNRAVIQERIKLIHAHSSEHKKSH
ncbi:hypothetical protein I302_104034 [Kwoniella bestiolae CBS 10118]|uniref:Uncharacterized protein n=1 Tax=Kwoniella bestiolae CBS 10118 TaxID=1296100 RepID=A0A1B9GA41_9TREE|nr:hypothetical protein I302_02739 [Kwoniella bestiolae CBS 10118]OCF27889.1 hypothetical protein I302_02739 [Kwoniella bestiolae CBS 10118]